MQIAIIENNARRNGEIIINGWVVDSSDIEIHGSDEQVAWARDILSQAIGRAIVSVGKSQGLMSEVSTTEADWAKLEPQAEQFLAQLAGIIDGVDARIVIDNRSSIQAIVAAAKEVAA